ncbi:MAG TPA: PAS domain-containing protein, partial [Nocardioidaceae bacterium]|nr:PAS domain-containing protein [Nocardioidaceae bacterium]
MSSITEPAAQVSLDAIPDGIVLADQGGQVTSMNVAARKMLRVEDGVGKHIADVVALQDQAGN